MTLVKRTIHQPEAGILDPHLGAVLAAEWKGIGTRRGAIEAFREVAKNDPAIRGAALQRRKELEALDARCNGQIARRDAVGAVHLRALREVLG